MLEVVQAYTRARRHNPLARFIPALKRVNGSESHAGLGKKFVHAWRRAAKRPAFRRAQNRERDHVYFNPAVALAKQDGLQSLGQFAYYDAAVVHGFDGMQGVRERALERATTPAARGGEARLSRGVPRRARRRDAQGRPPMRTSAGSRRHSAAFSASATSTSPCRSAGRSTATGTRSCARRRAAGGRPTPPAPAPNVVNASAGTGRLKW